MDALSLNRKAWNAIGSKIASPYLKHAKYAEIFTLFCDRLPKHARVLDVGCGPGIPIGKALVGKDFKVTGVDLSETMVSLAKNNVPEAGFLCMSMTDLDEKEVYDGIIAAYSMLCLEPEQFKQTAQRMVTALKPGGLLLVTLNEPSGAHKEEESYACIMGQRMYSRPYTETEVKAAFEDLTLVKVERELALSKEYGEEHGLYVLMKKP